MPVHTLSARGYVGEREGWIEGEGKSKREEEETSKLGTTNVTLYAMPTFPSFVRSLPLTTATASVFNKV
jgi:hypothetical protein